MKRKRCLYCGELFEPDSRLGNKQKTCGSEECKKRLKKELRKKWCKRNPQYFKGRYTATKNWLKKHPGYLKTYRTTHPEYVKKNCSTQRDRDSKKKIQKFLDIQESIKAIKLTMTNLDKDLKINRNLDIQESISAKVPVFMGSQLQLIPLKSFLDIQVPLGVSG